MARTTWNHTKNPDAPLRWRKPRQVRVTLTGKEIDAELDRLFAVMALMPESTFEVLVERPERMKEYLSIKDRDETIGHTAHGIYDSLLDKGGRINASYRFVSGLIHGTTEAMPGIHASCGLPKHEAAWPLPNVHIGTLCRTQAEVDHAAPLLLSMPNAGPRLRLEPSEGIDVKKHLQSDIAFCNKCGYVGKVDANGNHYRRDGLVCRYMTHPQPGLRYIELSGQTGPDAKPLHPQWARQIRDDCAAANVRFRFESWGQWVPYDDDHWPAGLSFARDDIQDRDHTKFIGDAEMYPAGPRRSGRILDGVEHDGQIEFNQQKGER